MTKELADFLTCYTNQIKYKNKALDDEEKQLITRLEAIKTERAQLQERQQRVINCPSDFGDICPRCYFERGRSVKLTPIPGDDKTDKSECPQCGYLLEEEA